MKNMSCCGVVFGNCSTTCALRQTTRRPHDATHRCTRRVLVCICERVHSQVQKDESVTNHPVGRRELRCHCTGVLGGREQRNAACAEDIRCEIGSKRQRSREASGQVTRACDQRCSCVLQHRVSLAVHDKARNHHGDELARLGQHLRRIAARSMQQCVETGAPGHSAPQACLMFLSASTPHAGPTVLVSPTRQNSQPCALPAGAGRTSSHSPDQHRHTKLCARFKNTTCVNCSFAAPYLRRRRAAVSVRATHERARRARTSASTAPPEPCPA